MKFSTNHLHLQLGVVVLAIIASCHGVKIDKVNQKRQVGADKGLVIDSQQDRTAEATGFLGAGAVQAHSKYFQYAHVPQKDHYEHGHRKGNEHHFIERHEKAHPHAGEFKTKVRWGDKHGGYGEHYWDYNHAGHGDAHDEGSEQVADYQTYQPEQARKKRQPPTAAKQNLALDPVTGEIYDQVTGKKYVLRPVN